MTYIVYAIYNASVDRIYIGQTQNLTERIRLHNNHEFKNGFTARFNGEWIIIYQETVETRNEALKREKQLKGYQGRQFIKKFIPR